MNENNRYNFNYNIRSNLNKDKLLRIRNAYKQIISSNENKNNKLGEFNRIIQLATRNRITTSSNKYRQSFNANTFIENFKNEINNRVSNGKVLVKSGRRISKSDAVVKYPWYIGKLDKETGRLRKYTIKVPSTSYTGSSRVERIKLLINWANNNSLNVYPKAVLNSTATNGAIKLQTVGKFCKSTNNQGWCGKKPEQRFTMYSINNNRKLWKVNKHGASGVGVPELSKAMLRNSLRNARRTFFDIKRSGDYGQIITCLEVNKDPSIFIINSGSEELAKLYYRTQNKQMLQKIKENQSYVYQNTLFWTGDRPACMLALLLGVPFVYIKDGNFNYSSGGKRQLSYNGGINVLKKLIMLYNNSTSFNIETPPKWYYLLSIIDTAHDFGKGSRIVKSRVFQFKTMVKDSMKGLFLNDPVITGNDIDEIFTKINSIEEDISNILLNNSGNLTSEAILFNLDQKNQCIVHDFGKMPNILKPKCAILSAKYLDPAS